MMNITPAFNSELLQVLDEMEVTPEDRAAAFIAHAAAEAAAADAPANSLSRGALRVASLHFTDGFTPVGVQGAICSGMRVNAQPGQLASTNSGEGSDRLGLTGVAVKERFRRAKRKGHK
jgi:hypothetical protein